MNNKRSIPIIKFIDNDKLGVMLHDDMFAQLIIHGMMLTRMPIHPL